MKKLFSIIGILLLTYPLLNYATIHHHLQTSLTATEVLASLFAIRSGLMTGCVGLMLLGFVMDAGSGFRPRLLLLLLALLGGLWIFIYPSGWMLGVPSLLYAIIQLYKVSQTSPNQSPPAPSTKHPS